MSPLNILNIISSYGTNIRALIFLGCLSATKSKPMHRVDIPVHDWPTAQFPQLKYPLDEHEMENRENENRALESVRFVNI